MSDVLADEGTQERYARLLEASGLRPDVDLSPAAQLLLSHLASAEDGICAGLVELLTAARQAAADPLVTAGRRLVDVVGVAQAHNQVWHAWLDSSATAVEARQAMQKAIAAAEDRG